MQIKCSVCGEMNEKDAKICTSCNQEIDITDIIIELQLQKFRTYSLVSFFLGIIGVGICTWLSIIFLNAPLIDKVTFYPGLAFVCLSLLLAIIGLIFGGMSVKPILNAMSERKMIKALLILGILFNLTSLILQLLNLNMIFVEFL